MSLQFSFKQHELSQVIEEKSYRLCHVNDMLMYFIAQYKNINNP